MFDAGLKPVAKPEYTYKNGSKYIGQWVNGFRHGNGKIIWPDGASYEGQWGFGQPTNHGIFKFSNGDIYEGSWAQN